VFAPTKEGIHECSMFALALEKLKNHGLENQGSKLEINYANNCCDYKNEKS